MISFLIVNYFTSELTKGLSDSIKKYLVTETFEILILDNSCNTSEWEVLSNLNSDFVKIFKEGENLGFVKGNNYLLKQAKGDILVLINPDTLLIDESLERLIAFLRNNDNIVIAGPMLLNEDKSYQTSFFKFPTIYTLIKEHIFLHKENVYSYKSDKNKIQDCEVVKGACLVVKRIFLEDEIFDPNFVMYSEETELCLRIRNSGKRIIYFPEAKILHYGEKSSSHDNASEYSLFNYYRSKLLLFKKHYTSRFYFTAKFILLFSLVEKWLLLFIFNRKKSSSLHYIVLKRIVNESKNISNMQRSTSRK